MQIKKIAKKTQKSRGKKLGIDPTLKPIVVDTSHRASKEEQEDNPLNRRKFLIKFGDTELPKAFKTADKLTEKDDLEFQIEKLTTKLSCWLDKVEVNGRILHCLVDPLNRVIEISEKPLHE
jgi:hypothetical protein